MASATNTPVALQGPSLKTVIVNVIMSSTLMMSPSTSTSLTMRKSRIGSAVKLWAEALLFVRLVSFPRP